MPLRLGKNKIEIPSKSLKSELKCACPSWLSTVEGLFNISASRPGENKIKIENDWKGEWNDE